MLNNASSLPYSTIRPILLYRHRTHDIVVVFRALMHVGIVIYVRIYTNKMHALLS